jgi:hypothetical protein
MHDLQLEYTDVGGLKIEKFAQQITPNVKMSDLPLPAHEKKLLYDLIRHVRRKLKVYEDQGVAEKSDRGIGLTVLFLGNSRTGKIMAAKVLANELKLDLYKVDLSAAVSI